MASEKCACFFDGGYIRKILHQFGMPRISYLRFSEELAGEQERLRSYYYDCPPFQSAEPTEQEKQARSAFDSFRRIVERQARFQVRLGRLQKIGDTYTQKMVDIHLACDLLKLSLEKQIGKAIIVAGDSDFVPAIQIARDSGTIVQLYYHRGVHIHEELLDACDELYPITEQLIEKIKLKK